MKELIKNLARRFLPVEARRKMSRMTIWPPVGSIRFGGLRRLKPISSIMGDERGNPVDRYYITRFLSAHAEDIRGHVLEVGTDRYSRTFGVDRVTKIDVLHVQERRPGITIVGDLTKPEQFSPNVFDCVILTQTLQFIFDVSTAVETVYRILKPGGTVLATVSGISQISRYDMDHYGHFWNFTSKSAQLVFEKFFPKENIQVETHGNVMSSIAFLHGLASEELRKKELDFYDPDYQLLISIKATKPALAT